MKKNIVRYFSCFLLALALILVQPISNAFAMDSIVLHPGETKYSSYSSSISISGVTSGDSSIATASISGYSFIITAYGASCNFDVFLLRLFVLPAVFIEGLPFCSLNHVPDWINEYIRLNQGQKNRAVTMHSPMVSDLDRVKVFP